MVLRFVYLRAGSSQTHLRPGEQEHELGPLWYRTRFRVLPRAESWA